MTEYDATAKATAVEIDASLAALPGLDLNMLAYDISDLLDRGDYGLPAIGQDDLRAGLRTYLMTAIAHAAAQSEDPHVHAPRNGDGGYIHTCNGDNPAGLGFGRRAPRGECARCDALADGAPARARFGGRQTAAQRDHDRCAEITAHFASDRHRSGGCGIVCTFGDY